MESDSHDVIGWASISPPGFLSNPPRSAPLYLINPAGEGKREAALWRSQNVSAYAQSTADGPLTYGRRRQSLLRQIIIGSFIRGASRTVSLNFIPVVPKQVVKYQIANTIKKGGGQVKAGKTL